MNVKDAPKAAYRFVRQNLLHRIFSAYPNDAFHNGKPGIEIVGFFKSHSGLGESARLCALQLAEAGFPLRCVSVEHLYGGTRNQAHEYEWNRKDDVDHQEIGCRIFHLNPPMMPMAILRTPGRFQDAYNIGYWAWELETLPREWQRALKYVNAVFTPSDFTSKAVQKYTSKPVITVPHPVQLFDFEDCNVRKELGIASDVFLVTNVFSFGSGVERKNPFAAIEAFAKAFGDDPKALFILKTNGGGSSNDKRALQARVDSARNMRLIDEVWSRDKTLSLIKDADVYISLHRSEGFGLTIAEAMLLGTATVVTDWSGNRDFCTRQNSIPIPADIVPVRSGHPEFQGLTDAGWAEANADRAAEALVELKRDPDLRERLAKRAKAEAAARFSQPVYLKALQTLCDGEMELPSIDLQSKTRKAA